MRKTLLGLAGLLLAGYLALGAGLYFKQQSLMYFPQPARGEAPWIPLPGTDAGIRVAVHEQAGAEAVVYLGGNAEDVSRTLPELRAAFPGQALYLLHYRGYGGSAGEPGEAALARDALALFDLAQGRHRRVQLIGRSLGSGLAVRVASQRPVHRLVLVTPFDSLQEIAASHYPWLPVRWLLRDKYESWRYAPRVRAPTLLIEAAHDEVIPRASTRALLGRFRPGVATLVVVPGAGHNSVSEDRAYPGLLRGDRANPPLPP